jgi:succinate dehydrogenase hydrophobic anchor subunit
MAIVVSLIVLFWHEKISGFLADKINPENAKLNTKLDNVLFTVSLIIVAVFALWLLRIVGE